MGKSPLLKKCAGVALRDLLDMEKPEGSDPILALVGLRARQQKLAELFEAAASEFWPDVSEVLAEILMDEDRLTAAAASAPFKFEMPTRGEA